MEVAIVAIPAADEPVWKVSSEKIPHLTLLYLGDTVQNQDEIAKFVQFAAENTMTRFGLNVDRRGTLGSEDADVLFFSDDDYSSCKEIKAFRSNLLRNDDILNAYNSTEQFPGWTPHLTLGYPATPAKEIKENQYLGWVRFDRIAVWFGDFDGPTFLLPQERNSLAMSDDIETFLAHHGVKGMRWGVRRTDAQLSNDDGGSNGVKSKSGVDITPAKLSRKEKKAALKEAAEAKAAENRVKKSFGENNSKVEIDNPSDVKLSEDAARFVHTRLKDGHEMSTREIQEAIKRAQQVKQYNELFNSPDQYNRDLHNRLDELETQARISAAEAALKGPSNAQKVMGLVRGLGSAYAGYKKFAEPLGLPDPIGDGARKIFGGEGLQAAKKQADKLTDDVKKEKERQKSKDAKDKSDDTPDKDKSDDTPTSPKKPVAPQTPSVSETRFRPTTADGRARQGDPRVKQARKEAERLRDQAKKDDDEVSRLRKEYDKKGTSPAQQFALAERIRRASGAASDRRREADRLTGKGAFAHEDLNDFLMHYGVKGMRWGVRRNLDSSVSAPSLKAPAKGESLAKSKVAEKAVDKPPMFPGSTVKRELAYTSAIAGATVAATMLAGPIGGIPVAALGRTLNAQRMLNDRNKIGSEKGVSGLKTSRNLSVPIGAAVIAKNGEALTNDFKLRPIGQAIAEEKRKREQSQLDKELEDLYAKSGLPKHSTGGPRFNPKADLDNSRIHQDTGASGRNWWEM